MGKMPEAQNFLIPPRISFIQHNAALHLVDFFTNGMGGQEYIDLSRYYVVNRDF